MSENFEFCELRGELSGNWPKSGKCTGIFRLKS